MRKNLFSAFLKRGLPIGILLFVTLACVNSGSEIGKQEPAQPAAKSTAKTVAAVIDIPKLIRQPPPEFEKLFGKATEVSKTNDPGTVPGEIHDYVLEGSGNYSTANGIMVRFFKNKAVMIMVDLPSPAPNAADALMQGRKKAQLQPFKHPWLTVGEIKHLMASRSKTSPPINLILTARISPPFKQKLTNRLTLQNGLQLGRND